MSSPDVVVIGAGTAGLAVSRHLQLAGVDHVVLERGRIAETWRSQRWDSFRINTPNHMSGMPGESFPGDPEGFATGNELAGFLDDYAARNELPVQEGVKVTSVSTAGERFAVLSGGERWTPGAVVVASGGQNHARLPALAAQLPSSVTQIHTDRYRNAAVLPDGAVLVVGSAQSGCQIVEDLLEAGRPTYLSVSRVARARRRYRGRDMLDWLSDTGFLDQRPGDLPDPAMMFNAQPQISGVGTRGHTVSLQGLARRGARLLGRLVGVEGSRLRFDDSVSECVAFADQGSAQIRGMIDGFIEKAGVPAGEVEPDAEDESCPDPGELRGPEQLAVEELGAVIWSTGFAGDFSWLELPVLAPDGRPLHSDGVSPIPGLYFAGLPWLRTRRSGIIPGVDRDGAWLAASVVDHLGG